MSDDKNDIIKPQSANNLTNAKQTIELSPFKKKLLEKQKGDGISSMNTNEDSESN
jgi:hypothetical protein